MVKNNKIRIQAEINSVQFQRGLNKMHRSYRHFLGNFKHTIKVATIVQDAFKKVFSAVAKGAKLAVSGIKKLVQGFQSLISKQRNYNSLQNQGQSDFSKNTKSVLAGLTGVGALAGVWFIAAKGMRAGLREMNASTDAQIKLDQVLKATGHAAGLNSEELMKSAQAMRRATRLSTSDVQAAQGVMLTFTKVGKDNFDTAMGSAADMSAMFGQSMQQSVIQLGTALNDPIAGVGRLMRIGVSFSEEQRKSIKLFMDQNDVMSAQKVILQELEHEFGGVAEALADTFFGRWTQLVNAIAELAGSFGQIIEKSPEVKKLLEDLRDRVNELAALDWNKIFITWRRNFIKGFKNFLSGVIKTNPEFVMAFERGFNLVRALWIVTTDKIKETWDNVVGYFEENSWEDILLDMKETLPGIIRDIFALMATEVIIGIEKMAIKFSKFWEENVKSAQTRTDGKVGVDDYILNMHEFFTGNWLNKDKESSQRRQSVGKSIALTAAQAMDTLTSGNLPAGKPFDIGVNEAILLKRMEHIMTNEGFMRKFDTMFFDPNKPGVNIATGGFKEGAEDIKRISSEDLARIANSWQDMLTVLEVEGELGKMRAKYPMLKEVLLGNVPGGKFTGTQSPLGFTSGNELFANILNENIENAGLEWNEKQRRGFWQSIFGYSGSTSTVGSMLGTTGKDVPNPIGDAFVSFSEEVKEVAESLGMSAEDWVEILDGWESDLSQRLGVEEEQTKAIEENTDNLKIASTWLKENANALNQQAISLGQGLAAGGSVRDMIAGSVQKFTSDYFGNPETGVFKDLFGGFDKEAGTGNIFGAIMPGLAGGLVGGLLGNLIRKKAPTPPKKPVPVKVMNWGDMTGALLKAGTRRNVSPRITSGGNIGLSNTFNRDMRY